MAHPGTAATAAAALAGEDPRGAVDAVLTSFLAEQSEVLLAVSPELGPLVDLAGSYLAGGKRLRPSFCYWGWRASGGEPGDGIHRAAASLELLQACALIHDDVMDGSDTRRGRPSAHRVFEAAHRERAWQGDPALFGEGAAILLGDLFLTWSDQLYTASGLPAPAIARGRGRFDSMRAELMAGQYLDLVVQSQADPDPAAIATVLRYKSAKYTIEHPLQLGALLAGAPEDLVAGLGAFGLPLGEAFQLRDDLLGVFGDPAVTGKPAGDDLREGKQTLLIAEAMAAGNDQQRALLRAGLGDPALTESAAEQMRTAIRDTGADAAVERHIQSRLAQALTQLQTLDIPENARGALAALAGASTQRAR
jgi:geranylgeranyl diphosphate synthase type I